MICSASEAYSGGCPSRAGCGICAASPAGCHRRTATGSVCRRHPARSCTREPASSRGRAPPPASCPRCRPSPRRTGSDRSGPPGGHRRGQHADAALAVDRFVAHHAGSAQPQHVERSRQIEPDQVLVHLQRPGAAVSLDDTHGAALAQCTARASRPRCSAASNAASTDAVSVTSPGANHQSTDSATASAPADVGRSSMTTSTLRCERLDCRQAEPGRPAGHHNTAAGEIHAHPFDQVALAMPRPRTWSAGRAGRRLPRDD